ncbi:maleylpyruvate isomerase family mycothiol-dependent enzyme [Streptomyces sp. SID13031]|uniref:maleylpyruvate isomerase family mycothiol-dependent enzyme n=1 Tax=Streptomyces sp. SID13031 TaxID=2706046 RepID=UPI0013C790D0|nr:maleylpyruvate isomerase family mycothiol-dependent enzyme [Streptomyces sp. SID13031]NEA35493.1 maleylpyruvate isomerase family mycothiol-dependent enzyme [Streptomyces sp. SID13031]
MSNADTVIAALRTSYDGLADLVKKFDDDALAGPSAATEWDIAQVLSHLGSGAEIMYATVQAALDGKPGPDGDFNQSVWGRWNAASRREQADGFLEQNEKLTALFESLDAGQRENLRLDLSYVPEPVDVATISRGRLSEFSLHSWDVRSAIDPQATLDPQAVPELLQSSGDLLAWITKPAALNGQSTDLAVTTTEPATELTLHLTEPVSIDLAPADKPDGTLSLPSETWLRLVSGRLDPAGDSAVELTGPVTLETLRQVFPGY